MFIKKKLENKNITHTFDKILPTNAFTLCLFQYYCFLKNGSFYKKYFLENYLIFRCLVTTLKMSLRMFSGDCYGIFFIYISCII